MKLRMKERASRRSKKRADTCLEAEKVRGSAKEKSLERFGSRLLDPNLKRKRGIRGKKPGKSRSRSL